jgi:hypothetical protein
MSAIARALPSDAPDVAVKMVAAQSALETAGWQSMWSWNFGNTTVYSTSSQPWIHQGTPGSAAYALSFKSFSSANAGAEDMVAWLTSHGCLPYAYAGDLTGYVSRLTANNYFGGADPVAYQAAMASWMKKLANVPYSSARFPWKLLAFAVGFSSVMVLGWMAIDLYVPAGGKRRLARAR